MSDPSFRRIEDSTTEDWVRINREYLEMAQGLVDRVLAQFRLLQGDRTGFPVDRYSHLLQSATLAAQDGRDDEYVVCTLLHDIGDVLAPYNHPDIAASMVRSFVSEENLWMVQHHGIVQGYYFFHHMGLDRNMRDQYRNSPHYERTVEFCAKYDNPAFDPDAKTMSLADFEPALRRVMAAPRNGIYTYLVQK